MSGMTQWMLQYHLLLTNFLEQLHKKRANLEGQNDTCDSHKMDITKPLYTFRWQHGYSSMQDWWTPDLIKITLLHKRVSRMASSVRNTRRSATFYEVQREQHITSALSNWRLASNIRPETTWNQAREIIS